MTDPVSWTNDTRTISDLTPWIRNPKYISKPNAIRLLESLKKFGNVEPLCIGPDGDLYNGHQRVSVMSQAYGSEHVVEVRVASRNLTETERQELTVLMHKGATGEFNWDDLANWDVGDLLAWGFTEQEFFDHGIKLDFAGELGVESGGSENKTGTAGGPVIQYAIIFETEEQQQIFYQFIAYCKQARPDLLTIAGRMTAVIFEKGLVA